MKRALLPALLVLGAACASAPRPGPTQDGIAVAVPGREKTAARRQAIETLLPLFVTADVRREKAADVEKAVFAPKRMKLFFGYQKTSKQTGGLMEVKIDVLSAALQGANLIQPAGYSSGPEVILLALGDRAAGITSTEHYAADVLETALFGRGVQAQDADDDIVKLKHPITAKTEADTVAQAAAGGWSALATGRVVNAARREAVSNSWRGRARYSLSLYGVNGSTLPVQFDADGEALNVSSAAAVMDAIDSAAQTAAMRMDKLMAARHVGRTTIGVLISGYKDPAFLKKIVDELRATEGVAGASLISWNGLDTMALIHVYAGNYTADSLAAKLINVDPTLRITAVETEDNRITLAGPEIPAAMDRGQEE